jgi:alkylation response protein AidB-like acyl-CoA dehydrogenase
MPSLLDPGVDLTLESDVRQMLRSFLADTSPLTATRRHVDSGSGYSMPFWRRITSELQIIGLGVPIPLGGDGLPPVLTGILFAEFGRALVPSPLLGTVGLAVPMLVAAGTDEAAARLAPILDGSATATVGWVGSEQQWDPAATPARLRGGTVTGSLDVVVDAQSADTVFVVARDEADRLRLVAVDPHGSGVRITPRTPLDLTRQFAGVELDGAAAVPVGTGDDSATVRLGLLHAGALLAAESAGAARHALEITVGYVGVRHQFGRPIGSFQAVKHRLADMLSRVELMEALALDAVRQVGSNGADAAEVVHAAQAYAADAFAWVAAEMVQLHGGLGFTWEHDAQLFFRRAYGSAQLLGSAAEHRAAIAGLRGWTL